MANTHVFEYSKSGKAKCHGACKDFIERGVLRYGSISRTARGERVQWRHWHCVTPSILTSLKRVALEHISGFKTIRPEDQAKIRSATVKSRIDAVDISNAAKPTQAIDLDTITASMASSSHSKRKGREGVASSSQAGPSSYQSSKGMLGSSELYATSQRNVIEIIDSEDEDVGDTEDSKDELYCQMRTNIVGVQYYTGMVGPGEEVIIEREPQNRYDANAIQVLNIGRAKLGHLSRQVAAKLAPLLDRGLVSVEGVVHEGNLQSRSSKVYTLSMTLRFYAASDQRNIIEPQLVWATPGQTGFASRASASFSQTNSVHRIPGASQQPSYRPGAYSGSQYTSGTHHAVNSPYPATSEYSIRSQTGSSYSAAMGTVAQLTTAQLEARRKQQEALSHAAELKRMLAGLEKVDDEGRRHSLLDALTVVDDVLGLPVHPSPPSIASGELRVNLLKHQSQALQWCIERENPKLPKLESDKPVQFWQLRKIGGKGYYYNLATKTPQEAPPMLNRGAICADSMGLGKTLTMIALILATKLDQPLEFVKSSLIIVPLSILSNWESQIKEHCTPGSLTYCVYYGAGRSLTPDELKKFDVVITTYNVVATEHTGSPRTDRATKEPDTKKRKTEKVKGLFDVKWKRIILDEGHVIRNPKTKMAKSVCALEAQRRWILSGTPIINSPRDLGSILAFLKICNPLDNEDFFKRLVLRPLKFGEPSGAELLRAIMSQSCIRRTKEMKTSDGTPLIPLPPVEIIKIPVTLSKDARGLYDQIEEISRIRVEMEIGAHGGFTTAVQSSMLSMLTRMRQLVLHPGLIPANYLEQLQSTTTEPPPTSDVEPLVVITASDRLRLQSLLAQAIEDNEECPICFGILSDPRSTPCAHFYCLACITEVITCDPRCPMDRRMISLAGLIEPQLPTDLTQAPVYRDDDDGDDEESNLRAGPSDKINQLVQLLRLTPRNEKSLVFSQFTSFLDKIAEVLEAEGIPYARFDGKMSAKRRQETLERFCIPLSDIDPESAHYSASQPQASQLSQTQQLPTGSSRRNRASSRRQTLVLDELPEGQDVVGQDDDDKFAISVNSEDDGSDFQLDEDDIPEKTVKGKAKDKRNPKSSVLYELNGPRNKKDANPVVMLISLKAGALGLNLTVANNVYLMDPWWQEGIESQAIDRCNRIGQKKPVHVYQLIAEDTVESKVIDIQSRKKKLVQEAFKGIKSTETQRQQREARLKDLIKLFGVRRQAANEATEEAQR